MNVTFHALASAAIGGVTASRATGGDGERVPPHLLGASFALGILSHGILDGLKHLYPLPAPLDVVIAPILFAGWLLLVRPRFRPLLALTFLGGVLPDLIDLGPRIAGKLLQLPLGPPAPHLFPWHWPAGSGSLYGGRDAAVSLTNHAIVVTFSALAIYATRRTVMGPTPSRS
jgi:hypothetical protein